MVISPNFFMPRPQMTPRFGNTSSLSSEIDGLLGDTSSKTYVKKSPTGADAWKEVTFTRTKGQYTVEVLPRGAGGDRHTYVLSNPGHKSEIENAINWAKSHGMDRHERDNPPAGPA